MKIITIYFCFILILFSLPEESKKKIELTIEEREYLKNLGPIKICVDPDWLPFEYVDEKGNYIGIANDLLSLVGERLEIKFELVRTKDWNETLEYAKQGKCQIIPFMNQTEEREKYLIFTDLFFTAANVLITHQDHPFITDLKNIENETMVLPYGTSVEEKIKRNYPNLTIILVNSELEAYKMVSEKKADMTLRALLMAAYTLRKDGLFNLKISGELPEYKNYLRIGVQKNEVKLRDILNKGIASITYNDRERIINQHVNINVITPFDYTNLIRIGIIIFIIVTLVLYWNYRLKKVNEEKNILLNNIKIQIWFMTDENTYGSVNESHANYFGKKISEMTNKNIATILSNETQSIIKNGIKEIFEKGEQLIKEVEIKNYKGENRLFLLTKSPKLNYKGKVEYIICTAQDITDKKNMEMQVITNNNTLKSIISILQYNSKSIQEFLDYTLDEVIKITKSKLGYIYYYDELKSEFILNSWSKDVMKECKVMNPQTTYCLDKTGI